jgi:hypothetical protein
MLPIVNVKALENLSASKLPKELRILKTPERKPPTETAHPFLNEKHLFNGSKIFQDPQLKHNGVELFPVKIQKTTKLYQLSTDGASSETMHELCDNKGPCIVLVKTFGKYVFGFYTPVGFS